MDIALIMQDAHEADEAVGVLALAARIRRHVTANLSLLAEPCQPALISSPGESTPPREGQKEAKAERGVLPKPRIRITAAMQRAGAY
ncbi:hypothetical protein [Bosea beijingensis]